MWAMMSCRLQAELKAAGLEHELLQMQEEAEAAPCSPRTKVAKNSIIASSVFPLLKYSTPFSLCKRNFSCGFWEHEIIVVIKQKINTRMGRIAVSSIWFRALSAKQGDLQVISNKEHALSDSRI